eukprot:6245680-Prymnesium_polylepis.2
MRVAVLGTRTNVKVSVSGKLRSSPMITAARVPRGATRSNWPPRTDQETIAVWAEARGRYDDVEAAGFRGKFKDIHQVGPSGVVVNGRRSRHVEDGWNRSDALIEAHHRLDLERHPCLPPEAFEPLGVFHSITGARLSRATNHHGTPASTKEQKEDQYAEECGGLGGDIAALTAPGRLLVKVFCRVGEARANFATWSTVPWRAVAIAVDANIAPNAWAPGPLLLATICGGREC